jgi:hypothetical protein
MQPVHARNQVKRPRWLPGGRGRAYQFKACGRPGHCVEGVHQVHPDQDDLPGQPGPVHLAGRLDQRTAGTTAQVQPRDGAALRAAAAPDPGSDLLKRIEPQLAGVAVDAGQLPFPVHRAVGDNR